MEENKQTEVVEETTVDTSNEEVKEENVETPETQEEFDDKPLDKNIKLMSPGRMLARRFFRSKLSVTGLIMLGLLFVFCWFGPLLFTQWGETETDRTGNVTYTEYVVEVDGVEFVQYIETNNGVNALAEPSANHILGTDEQGMDIFTRLMYGGRLSLMISFLAVFLTSALGIIIGGIAGYYGGVVDNILMRVCDVLMCLPTLPLMLIIGTVLDSNGVPSEYYIYLLMGLLSLFSWTGMARLVRGQILSLPAPLTFLTKNNGKAAYS